MEKYIILVGTKHSTVGHFDLLISKSTLDNLKKKVDQSRIRPTDITLQIPSSEKFRKKQRET